MNATKDIFQKKTNPRVEELKRVISHLDTLYEVGDDCIHPDTQAEITDGEYDAMRRELASLLPKGYDDKFFATPTQSHINATGKVKHDPPMTSISKASHEDMSIKSEMLFKWLAESSIGQKGDVYDLSAKNIDGVDYPEYQYNGKTVTYPRNYFAQSWKLDGLACALYYVDGKLVSAGLRPRDGINGEDITEQIKYVANAHPMLKKKVTCSIRGEIICKLSDFKKVQEEREAAGEDVRANPRNHAAGGIRQFKDPTKVKQQRLTFLAYCIESLENAPYKTEIERAKYCNKDLGIEFVQVRPFNFYDLQKMEDSVDQLDYEVDGVIVVVNNLDDQEQLGRTGDPKTGNPKGKIAWKFSEEEAKAKIKEITWKTGRTGELTPVAVFDPVRLAGTNVSKATLHNYGFMVRGKIDIGTTVIVLKAGKIIPKVVGVADGKCTGEPNYETSCPSCGHTTKIETTSTAKGMMQKVVCTNTNDCPSQNITGLRHYLETFGVLGLGESKIAKLVEGGAVSNYVDFYKLDVAKCMDCDLTERESLLALAAVHMVPKPSDIEDNDKLLKTVESAMKKKKSVPLWKLFASFGISSAGKSAGMALVSHFGSFDAIRNATVSEMEAIDDIGEKTAILVYDYLEEHSHDIDDLLKFVEPELPKTGSLSGKKFVLTGGFPNGKKAIQASIEDLGGQIGGSVSKTTDYVVVGTDAGAKADKAAKLGITMLTEQELEKML